MVGVYYFRIVARIHLVDFAVAVVANNVVGSVSVGKAALGSGHIVSRNVDLRLMIVTAHACRRAVVHGE